MFLSDFERSALTKGLPIAPSPAGSIRPRAKTTSTWGQAAEADGMAPVVPGTALGTSNPATARRTAAARSRPRRTRRPGSLLIPRILTEPIHVIVDFGPAEQPCADGPRNVLRRNVDASGKVKPSTLRSRQPGE